MGTLGARTQVAPASGGKADVRDTSAAVLTPARRNVDLASKTHAVVKCEGLIG